MEIPLSRARNRGLNESNRMHFQQQLFAEPIEVDVAAGEWRERMARCFFSRHFGMISKAMSIPIPTVNSIYSGTVAKK